MRISGAVLAGGKARRLGGQAKGALPTADGRMIVARLFDALAGAGIVDIIVLANDAAPYRGVEREIVADRRPGLGPLGGIETALTRFQRSAEATCFLPCDMPAVTSEVIRRLRAVFEEAAARLVFARTPFFCHPLCSIVHNGLLGAISAALDRDERRVNALWQSLGGVPVDFPDERPFLNINTIEELQNWREGELAP